MTSEYAPQAMLFGIAIDLALLGLVYLRMWRDYYRTNLLIMIVVLGLGAVLGFASSAYWSRKAEALLLVYELLLPFVFWLQLARFLPRAVLQWVPLPLVGAVGALAWVQGWGFQSGPLLVYELASLLTMLVLVFAWSMKGSFSEGEPVFLLSALVVLVVMGPAYAFVWPDMGLHSTAFAIVGGIAASVVAVGKMRSSFLHLDVPSVAGKVADVDGAVLGPGLFIVPPGRMGSVKDSFMKDIRLGRYGLWVSKDPVARVKGQVKGRGMEGTMFVAQLTHADFVENALDPSDSGKVQRSLAEFLKRTGNGIILVSDGHYLVSNTDVWEVAEVMGHLARKVAPKGSTILFGSDLLADHELDHLRKMGMKDLA